MTEFKKTSKPVRIIGNETDAGASQLLGQVPYWRRTLVQEAALLKRRSAQFDELKMIASAETQRRLGRRKKPVPKPKIEDDDDLPLLTTISNNILLIAVLEAVVVGAGEQYLNYAFLAYGLYVLLFRISSRKVFGAALLSLILIPIVTAFHRETLGDSFAVMTFYFLLIGLIRSVFELRRAQKIQRKKAAFKRKV